MNDITEAMESLGFQGDTSGVDTLMQDQHYGASLALGYQLLGDYDDE